ncbi:MAG: hypothetical protein ABIT37_11950 [Luteolibacter sp.]
MNSRIQNQLNMVGTCINVAQKPDSKTTWEGKPPLDFGTDLDLLETAYGGAVEKAALAEAAHGGAADEKSLAEGLLEDSAYLMARALVSHYKKTSNLNDLGKVDVSKTDIKRLRTQELVTLTTVIRDLALTAVAEPDADKRGVTFARVAALTAAITRFAKVMNDPRGQIVNRNTLLKELETDTAAIMAQVNDMDDLVIQFEGTEAGARFIAAWKRARVIVDAGGSHGDGEQPAPAVNPEH